MLIYLASNIGSPVPVVEYPATGKDAGAISDVPRLRGD
jgi:hypothetical protein